MNFECRRIFISDLPEGCTREELESNFCKYGQVSSIEVKERKELGPKNKSLFFAYVNLITDDKGLNQCFRDFSNKKLHGENVVLQVARESFLERLKRERETSEASKEKPLTNNVSDKNSVPNLKPVFKSQNNTCTKISKKIDVSQEVSTDSETSDEDDTVKNNKIQYSTKVKEKTEEPEVDEKIDIVIKNNKNKIFNNGILKIPSVGKTPIAEITKTKDKNKQNDSEANLKRLQSLREMKKGYAAQKCLIKNALTYGTNKPNNKIVFDDEDSHSLNLKGNERVNGIRSNTVFDNDSEDDFEPNFEVKEQFQGKSGQKLLELQSRYKNDKRFALDERFIEDQNDADVDEATYTEENLEDEKNEQLKILEKVLGKKVVSHSKKNSDTRKGMFQFDPSQPEHKNLELTISEPEKKRKKVEKADNVAADNEKPEPAVSKETFYKVPDKLKDTFSEKPQFSLLSMFGRTDEDCSDKKQDNKERVITKSNLGHEQNPFKYDSSDDEDEIEDIPHNSSLNNKISSKSFEQVPARTSHSVFWTEPFFFKTDDFRLQEGVDFLEKVKTDNKEFVKVRRELKGIVKAKVKNNERKNRMFKKKIGGSKRRKHIRIKKALKR